MDKLNKLIIQRFKQKSLHRELNLRCSFQRRQKVHQIKAWKAYKTAKILVDMLINTSRTTFFVSVINKTYKMEM